MAQNFTIATFANNISAANSTGLYYSGVINATSFSVGTSFTVNTTTININSLGFYANGSLGTSGQYLTSNGSATFWSTGVTTGKSIAMAIVFGG